MTDFFTEINFPYPSLRQGQDKFIEEVFRTIKENKNILINAPTGLGKTISGLLPAIYIAKQKNLMVVCLTSRQTQANQIIKTIKDINEKSKDEINYVAFIGKRSMCAHYDKDLYPAQDFNDFCKKMKEQGKCKFFMNTKNTDYEEQIKEILAESSKSFMDVEGFVSFCRSNNFCPYELAGKKAYQADVIICDYNYFFATGISENFLGKLGRDLSDCILIVDEAHNLPDRIRGAHSYVLSTELIKNALKEMNDFIKEAKYDSYLSNLKTTLEEIYFDKILGDKIEILISKDEFLEKYLAKFNLEINIKKIIDKLRDIEAIVKEDRIISYIGRVANFLEMWISINEEEYLRVLEKNIKKDTTILSLKIKCIDPGEISSEVINSTYSTIFMSGTLTPIEMYKDILGVENAELLELESPFSKQNQLTLVIDDVTTKYTNRNDDMYKRIANHIENVLNATHDKNAIVFFPSYVLMEKITGFVSMRKLGKKILKEQRYMTKEEKEKYVYEFKNDSGFDNKAKVLFAITSGSFAEGLDLPSKMLEVVIVVGLPLGVPDLFTNSVIRHFDKKFNKGQMYGYIYPAMNKIVQAAGRCIRTEEDKGVIVLMDNRFLWALYAQTFPKHWKLHRSKEYALEIGNFFD